MALGLKLNNEFSLIRFKLFFKLIPITFVENIITLHSVFNFYIVLELVIGIIKNAVSVKINPHSLLFRLRNVRADAIIDYSGIYRKIEKYIINKDKKFIQKSVMQSVGINDKLSVTFSVTSAVSEKQLQFLAALKRHAVAVIISQFICITVDNRFKLKAFGFIGINFKLKTPENGGFHF